MPEKIATVQNGNSQITRRIVRVQVEVSQLKQGKKTIHETRTYEGLNVRFNILKRRGSVQNKCDISICNLNKEQIEYLTTINAWSTPTDRKMLRVYAGYKDASGKENVGLIFQGDIIRALPTTEPDVWLECNCLTGYQEQLISGNIVFNGEVSVLDICQGTADKLGLPLNWKVSGNKKVKGFYYSGSLGLALQPLNEFGGITVYRDDEELVAEDEDPSVPKEGTIIRSYSQLSGLIGRPEPDQWGVRFKVLLDPSLKCGEPVQLKSELIPAANGVYWIYSIRHFGELRGREFYSEIMAKTYRYGG